MNKKVKYLLIFVTLTSLLFLSCQIGLGKEVDLEAPTIKLTKMQSGTVELPSARFGGGIYCGKKVSFFGTATDNEGVDSVYAEIKWSNETEYKYFADATLTGETFRFDLTFEQNGTAYIKFVATDKAKNYNVNSSKVVTLLVDDQAPVGEAWYIDRHINGITYPLKDIEELKKVDFNSQDNKDVAQNVEFLICSAFKDEMGIKPGSISIQIKNEKNELICTIPNSSTNDYSPVFEITHETLVKGNAELATGRHFLQIWYNAEDIVELPDSNKAQDVQVPCGWFVWEPESDNPKITQSPLPAENTDEVLVNVKDTVYATLFDDDGLKEVFCALLKSSEYNPTTDNQNLVTNIQEIFNRVPEAERSSRVKNYTPSSTERDVVLSFTAPDSPQGMYLVCYVKDVCEKTTTKVQLINVTDATAPTLHIASPANNSIPKVTMSSDSKSATVTIEGQTLDTSGCTYLEFLWVPNSFNTDNNKKAEKANAVFNSISSSEYAPQSEDNAKQSSLENGIKLWSVKLGPEETAGNGYKKQSFNFNIDLLNDFDPEKNEEKFFVVRVTRKDGKQTIQQYKLSADNLPPVIKSITPEAKTQIVESNKDYVLEFYAEKTNGVAIDTSKYKIYQNENGTKTTLQGEFDSSTKTYKYTIPKTTLEEWEIKTEKPVFIFEAADIFGNSVSSQYTLIINNLPQLKSITSPAPQNCKLGQPIQINANFSSAITLTDADLKGSYILLTNIKNGSSEKECKAVYKSGAGSQTIIFEYTPVEGDYTDTDINVGVKYEYDTETTCAKNLIKNCAKLKDGENVHLNTLLSSSALNGKQIKVDAVSPKVSSISVSADKEYLKAGETVTATATFTESILVQGSPALKLKVGSEDFELNLESSTSDTITFKGTVTKGLTGNISYSHNCITEENRIIITDRYGNSLDISSISSDTTKYYVDTEKPKSPRLTDASGNDISSGEKNNVVSFKINKQENDDIVKFEYSLDGGTSWTEAVEGRLYEIKQDANLCARVTDRAGNISDSSSPIQLQIDGFPDFIVECTNTDGFYDVGQKINFKVTFDKPVNIESNNANLTIGTNQDGAPCSITTMTPDSGETSEVFFTYIVKQGDEFTIDVTNVDFGESIKNRLGFIQDGKQPKNACVRSGVRCDTLAPTVKSAIPNDGTKTSPSYIADKNNIYTTGNQIQITFSEPVQKGSGNVILRQTAGWAIPPVLTAEEFNTICNQLNDTQKNILALRNPDGTLMEDVEDNKLYVAYRNNKYHGTGQYVGPYKKSMHGVADDGTPDISPKFVLDFDLDIWNDSSSKAFGKTYNEYTVDQTFYAKTEDEINKLLKEDKDRIYSAYPSNKDLITPKTPTDKTISVKDIRDALESAGYHKRTLDVTSPLVTVEGSIVTVDFPAGLTGDVNLPLGREWELIFEDGTFLDMSGKKFNSTEKDSRGNAGLIKVNSNDSFYSDKVATPVIRVDRYSYGLGIKQSDNSGNLTEHIKNDKVEPTGYVRVRIDCETKDAKIKYLVKGESKGSDKATTEKKIIGDTEQTTSYISSTSVTKPSEQDIKNVPDQNSSGVVFAVGSGSYKESYKGIIGAVASKDFNKSDVSAIGTEGVFQTVVQFVNPTTGGEAEGCQSYGKTDWSIRGTTSQGNEPSISPFPLRDSLNGSPYLRITYRDDKYKNLNNDACDYYWVSYEILVESSFSGQGWARNWRYFYNWAKNWGIMEPGEYTRVTNMKNWE